MCCIGLMETHEGLKPLLLTEYRAFWTVYLPHLGIMSRQKAILLIAHHEVYTHKNKPISIRVSGGDKLIGYLSQL